MLSKQYVEWCIMLGLLILSAGAAVGALIAAILIGAGIFVAGIKGALGILVVALINFLICGEWFLRAAE